MFYPDLIPLVQVVFIILAVAGLTKIFFTVIRQHLLFTPVSVSILFIPSVFSINKKQLGTAYYNFFRYQIWRFYRFI